jgi:hypothetical protein
MAPQANPDTKSFGAGECDRCANSMRLHALAERLAGLGLASRVITCPGDDHEDDHAEQIVVTNPAAPGRGELRISDDASVTWEYFGTFDGDGSSKILDEAINTLRATGLRLPHGEPR